VAPYFLKVYKPNGHAAHGRFTNGSSLSPTSGRQESYRQRVGSSAGNDVAPQVTTIWLHNSPSDPPAMAAVRVRHAWYWNPGPPTPP
jgi:hypothetical protein